MLSRASIYILIRIELAHTKAGRGGGTLKDELPHPLSGVTSSLDRLKIKIKYFSYAQINNVLLMHWNVMTLIGRAVIFVSLKHIIALALCSI